MGAALSRRQMLVAAGVAALPGFRRYGGSWVRRAPSMPDGAAGDRLALARFAPHVGSAFVVQHGGHATAITLEEATARPPHPADRPHLSGEAFSLIFGGDPSPTIPGGIHTVEHPALGRFPLCLLGVDMAASRLTYQAVVDRRAPSH